MLNHISNMFGQLSDKYVKDLQAEFDRNGYVFQNPGSIYFFIEQKTHPQSSLSCRFTKKPDLPGTYDMILDKGSDNDINDTIQNIFNRFYCMNRLINIINTVYQSLKYSYDNTNETHQIHTWKINNNDNQSKISIKMFKKLTSNYVTLSFLNTNDDNSAIIKCNSGIIEYIKKSTDLKIDSNLIEGNTLSINILKK